MSRDGAGPLLVVLPAWVLGDGTVPPPAVGDHVAWPLGFREHGPDPTTQQVTASADCAAEPDVDAGPAGTTWLTWLTGVGWLACWSAPRAVSGPVRLTGSFRVDPLGDRTRAVAGTVADLQVISEAVDGGQVVPGSVRLRWVAAASRWLDDGPPRVPRRPLPPGGTSGYAWLTPEDMEPLPPHRRETGVLVTLALDGPEVAGRP